MKIKCKVCRKETEIDELVYAPGDKVIVECPRCGNELEATIPKRENKASELPRVKVVDDRAKEVEDTPIAQPISEEENLKSIWYASANKTSTVTDTSNQNIQKTEEDSAPSIDIPHIPINKTNRQPAQSTESNTSRNQTPANSRSVRVFISSTFTDMMEERDYIMKVVYPTLLEESSRHGVTLTFVDLRWGITEEESRSGKVVQICMDEIDHSRPFFIGLIGSRYGWIPGKNDIENYEQTISKYPFLKQYVEEGLSVTEMEMRYGVLDTDKSTYALFFMKQEYNEYTRDAKMTGLCSLIERTPNLQHYTYTSVVALGEKIVSHYLEFLNQEFPLTTSTPYYRLKERLDFIRSNGASNYVGLLPHVPSMNGNSPIRTCIIAESGQGKTTFMAAIAEKLSQDPNNIVIFYSDEETFTSKSLDVIVEFLADSIGDFGQNMLNPWDRLSAYMNIVDDSEDNYWFVLDGVTALHGCCEETLLRLIKIIGRANIIISLNPKSELIPTLGRVDFKVASIEHSEEDLRNLIINYFSSFRKRLTTTQLDMIMHSSYESLSELHSKLNWLREYSSFESLNDDILYLSAITLTDMYKAKLEDLKASFGLDVVNRMFCMMLCVSRGLTEVELRELLGLSMLDWTLLLNASRFVLTEADGILNIKKDFCQFLFAYMDPLIVISPIDSLIAYFKSKKDGRGWLILADLYHSTSRDRELLTLLLNYASFKPMIDEDSYDVARLWNYLISKKSYSLEMYDDMRFVKLVNTPQKADYGIISKFIELHFPLMKELAVRLIKHNEYEKNTVGVWDAVLNETTDYLSPLSLCDLARNSKTAKEAVELYEKAIFYQKDGDRYYIKPILNDVDAIRMFDACLEMSRIAFNLYMDDKVRLCLDAAEKILHGKLNSASYFRAMMINTVAEILTKMDGDSRQGLVQECDLLLSDPDVRTDDKLVFEVLSTKMRINMAGNEVDLNEIASLSEMILKHVDTRLGRNSKFYIHWLINDIIYHIVARNYYEAALKYKEFAGLTGRLLNVEDLKFLKLQDGMPERALCELYKEVGDVAALWYYSQQLDIDKAADYNVDLAEERENLVMELLNNSHSNDNEYLCRLIFKEENGSLNDDLFDLMFDRSTLEESKLADVLKNLRLVLDAFQLKQIPEDLYDLFKLEGVNSVLHTIHIRILEAWRVLLKSFPMDLSGMNILNDDSILDVAETACGDLQTCLIILLETMIEIEGFYIDYTEKTLKFERESLQKSLNAHRTGSWPVAVML